MSKAAASAFNYLLFSPTLKYGGFDVTKGWKEATNLSGIIKDAGGSDSGRKRLFFNPENPSEYFVLDLRQETPAYEEPTKFLGYVPKRDAAASGYEGRNDFNRYAYDSQSYQVDPAQVRQIFGPSFDFAHLKTSQDLDRDKYLAELTAKWQSGELDRDTANDLANSYTYEPDKPTSQRIYDAMKEKQAIIAERKAKAAGLAGGVPNGASGGGNGSNNIDDFLPAGFENLPPEMQGLYSELKGYLAKLKAKGLTINPNVQITPQKLLEFTKQAEKEINPYYTSQLKLAREGLMSSLGYSKEQVMAQEQELEQRYGRSLRGLGEDAADRGFAQSGLRQRDERELAADTQNQIDAGRRSLNFAASNSAREFTQAYGDNNLTTPTIAETPRVLAGEGKFERSGRSLPFYQLSPSVYDGLVGTQQYQQRADISRRTSELEQGYRLQQGIDQARKLTL